VFLNIDSYKRKALLLIGARQVGKTTLLQDMKSGIKDVLWLNSDDNIVRDQLYAPFINDLK